MCLIILTDQGSSIRRESRRVFVEKDERELFEIPTRKVSAIAIMGNAQISTQALALFADEGIPVTYLTIDGGVKGQFLPVANRNLHLRYDQYCAALDEEFTLNAARYYVTRKLKEYPLFYRNIQKHTPVPSMEQLADIYQTMLNESESAAYHELLGIEGSAARIHFAEYGKYFRGELGFNGRNRNPPRDEVNALLSFGYAMLFKLINGLLHSAGLDIYNGFLHRPSYNRASLTCDFTELYRVNTVDRFVLTLCNKGMIRAKDFYKEGEGLRLNQDALKTFLTEWKKLAFYENNSQFAQLIGKDIGTLVAIIKKRAGRHASDADDASDNL